MAKHDFFEDGAPAADRQDASSGRPPSPLWRILSAPLLLLAVATLLSLFSYQAADIPFQSAPSSASAVNWMGRMGAYWAYLLLLTFGLPAYLLPVYFAWLAFCSILGRHLRWRPLWGMLFIACFCALFEMLSEPLMHVLSAPALNIAPNAGGGIGYLLNGPGTPVNAWLGAAGAACLYATGLVMALVMMIGPRTMADAWRAARERRAKGGTAV